MRNPLPSGIARAPDKSLLPWIVFGIRTRCVISHTSPSALVASCIPLSVAPYSRQAPALSLWAFAERKASSPVTCSGMNDPVVVAMALCTPRSCVVRYMRMRPSGRRMAEGAWSAVTSLPKRAGAMRIPSFCHWLWGDAGNGRCGRDSGGTAGTSVVVGVLLV